MIKKDSIPRGGMRPQIMLALKMISIALVCSTARAAIDVNVQRIAPYLMPSRRQEIALARSAAPPSISMHATVMALSPHGYVTVVKGSNGFVCLVVRSWDNAASVRRSVFWNPRFRAPFCYNAPAALSVLPWYLTRTLWVVAGARKSQIAAREAAAAAHGRLKTPLPGALCYMMSRRGRGIGGKPGPWRPHLMFYFPRGRAPSWGENLPGVPVFSNSHDNVTIVYVLVPEWSDGLPSPRYK